MRTYKGVARGERDLGNFGIVKAHAHRISLHMHATAHENREEQQMGNPVVHFEIIGKDARVLQSFYKDDERTRTADLISLRVIIGTL